MILSQNFTWIIALNELSFMISAAMRELVVFGGAFIYCRDSNQVNFLEQIHKVLGSLFRWKLGFGN